MPTLATNIDEINQIDNSTLSIREKFIHLKRVLDRNCKELTDGDSLQFPSLFSRIVFISQKFALPSVLERRLQSIRIKANFLFRDENHLVSLAEYQQARDTLIIFFQLLEGEEVASLSDDFQSVVLKQSLDRVRVQVLEIDFENDILVCQSESEIKRPITVIYRELLNDTHFSEVINSLWVGVQLNLIDVKIDNNETYRPKAIVLEPDYLIDASAIAECFQSYGNSYLHYFRRKFEPNANSHYILLGNLANFFLDELIYSNDPKYLAFDDVFQRSFKQMPFEYASCPEIKENLAFRDFMFKAQKQFDNIRRVVVEDMPKNGFNPLDCILEPSFFCEKYGFQGRLDLLQRSTSQKGDDRIIELKSGKAPYPREDMSRVASNHEAQTVVYRLMIQTVFSKDSQHIYPQILYSSVDTKGANLRYTAVYKQLEREIINIRNLIVATEYKLAINDGLSVESLFKDLVDPDAYGKTPSFFIEKLDHIHKIKGGASSLEKAYFYRYISFIARELFLQKSGDAANDSFMSISGLWNSAFEERKEALELIANLEIENIDDSGRDMIIRFRRDDSGDCVNFREGDICILYPHEKEEDTVLTNQILKGTVVEISSQYVVLRFRYKQQNKSIFSQFRYWAVEHDKLDHSYNSMFKSLFAFLSAPKNKRELLLGLTKPQSNYSKGEIASQTREETQRSIIEKALAAEDYFLIVGPPGTGKTSVFARKLVERLFADEDTNILVMAYTNRAVDELCSAITEALVDSCDGAGFIRIGTEFSCGESYRHRLLQNISNKARNRKTLLDIIDKTRIFVGTLASIVGKPEIFDLKKFNVAIIDEASQILEPQIIGLLPLFDKFIMIGDHKQLSTITLQDKVNSAVTDETLNTVELYNCRESLFERLYRIANKHHWTHVYDTLVYHGRMHEEIASLVNSAFYDRELKIMADRQKAPLYYPSFDASDQYESLVTTNRVCFIPSRIIDYSNASNKVNSNEADIVVELAKSLLSLCKKNNKIFDADKSLGIITPYRNQIALIKKKLEETNEPKLQHLMVDTVERFQGSQRDVIIISFCFNRPHQLRYFSNMNNEGTVDRKLNVALTRAREQLFIVGNDLLLKQNLLYKKIFASFIE